MKVAVYNCAHEERAYFEAFSGKYGLELQVTRESPSFETAPLSEGCACVSILSGTVITPALLDSFLARGVRFISTRTIGYDHIDVDYAESIGIAVANITYSASSVADYAIMMMLMALRKIKPMLLRAQAQDFTVAGLCGRELPNMTVGIYGTGRIGATLARHLSGFGCRILAYTRRPVESLRPILTYVSKEALFRESDILSLHLPLDASTYHIIDEDVLAQMKPGALLVNTARGPLVDSGALIDALESGRLGGAALDVVEGDREIYYRSMKGRVLRNRQMEILNAMPNVVMLPHMAYYTDQAVSDMVEHSLESCAQFLRGEKVDGLIVPPTETRFP